MRILGAVRLSALTDETTSPERQEEQITLQARARGDELVTIVHDLDVSGAISPFDRERLGPWLTDPARIRQWDGIMVAKLDRLSRSLLDFQTLLIWCREHGKTVVSVSEGIDFSTPTGEMFGNILVMFAQFERQRMAERRREAKAKLDARGRWNGGKVPFGYKPYDAGNGWHLIPDTEGNLPILRDIVARIIAGESANAICRDLNARKIPTSTGKSLWRSHALTDMLRSPVLKGMIVSNGQIVRDADYVAVRREPLITDEEWDKLQAALNAGSQAKSGRRTDAAPMLRIAFCGECDSPMYIQKKRAKDRKDRYVCGGRHMGVTNCKTKSVTAADLETRAHQMFLARVGHLGNIEAVIQPAEDHSAELASVEEAMTQLENAFVASGMSAERYATTMARLEARHAALSATESRKEGKRWVQVGPSVSQHFQTLTEPQKRAYLLEHQVRIIVTDDGLDLDPGDFAELLNRPPMTLAE